MGPGNFNKVADSGPGPVKFANILQTPILKNIYKRLLLEKISEKNFKILSFIKSSKKKKNTVYRQSYLVFRLIVAVSCFSFHLLDFYHIWYELFWIVATFPSYSEVAAQRCPVKRCFRKFRKIHRKTPVPETLFLTKLQASGLQVY